MEGVKRGFVAILKHGVNAISAAYCCLGQQRWANCSLLVPNTLWPPNELHFIAKLL